MHGGNTNVCTCVTVYFSFCKWREGEEAARLLVRESTVNVKSTYHQFTYRNHIKRWNVFVQGHRAWLIRSHKSYQILPSEYLTLWSSYGKFIEKAALSRFSNAANLLAEELRRQITAVCGGKKLLEACSTSRKGARVCVCVRARSSLITAKFANVSVISVFLRNFKSFARNDDLTS